MLDFKWMVIREISYKYSMEAENRFFDYFFEVYLFVHYAKAEIGRADFLADHRDSQILKAELKSLRQKGESCLQNLAEGFNQHKLSVTNEPRQFVKETIG